MATQLNPLSCWIAERVLKKMIGKHEGDGRRIELSRYDIDVEDESCRERILGVLRSFFGGFETAIKDPDGLVAESVGVSDLFQPFYHEGAAMGFGARELLRLRSLGSLAKRFEKEAVPAGDPFVFLRYMGLGFWLGFRLGSRVEKVDALAERLEQRGLRHLVHDGFGFQVGFFEQRRKPRRVLALRRFEGFGRASAFNGLGRSLWFFHMDRPQRGFAEARTFGEDALAVFGGMGLAATFTRVDDLVRPYEAAAMLSGEERKAFEKGIRIALYCRHENDSEYLDACVSALDGEARARARDDIRRAVDVGEANSKSVDFIERFHAGCET